MDFSGHSLGAGFVTSAVEPNAPIMQSYVELTPAAVVAVALVIITSFVLGLVGLRGSQRGGGQGGKSPERP